MKCRHSWRVVAKCPSSPPLIRWECKKCGARQLERQGVKPVLSDDDKREIARIALSGGELGIAE